MANEFKLPELGENVESGDIVNVLVKEGDEIQADQTVFEVETGKATVDLPSPQAGKITKVHVQKGSKVKVGDALLTFESAGKPAADGGQSKPAPAKAEPRLSNRRAPGAAAQSAESGARQDREAGGPRQSATTSGSGASRRAIHRRRACRSAP